MSPNDALRMLLQNCHGPGCTDDKAFDNALTALEYLEHWLTCAKRQMPDGRSVVAELLAKGSQ